MNKNGASAYAVSAALLHLGAAAAFGQVPEPPEAGLEMTLEDYVASAVKQGTQGLEAVIGLEFAAYARRIAFRQTDSPSLTANFAGSLSETRTMPDAGGYSLARARTGQTGLTVTEPLPTGTVLTLTGTRSNSLNGSAAGSVEANSNSYTAQLAQPVYLFVQNSVLRSRKRAALGYQNAKETFDQQILGIKTQAASLYYDVMQQADSVEVQRRTLAQARKLLAISGALVEAGKSAAVEKTRAEIGLQDNERQFQNAQASLQTAVLSAKNFISVPLEQKIRFVSHPDFQPLNSDPDKLEAYALGHNQQVTQLRRSVELAALDVAQSKEPARPVFALTAGYNWQDQWATRKIKAWSLGTTASWLLFDSFITRYQVSQALLAQRTARLNLADAERSTRLQIQSSFLNIRNIERQILDFKNSLAQAQQNIEATRTRFQGGKDRLIDVFDVETVARNLELQYLGLLINHRRLKDQLSQAVGAPVDSL